MIDLRGDPVYGNNREEPVYMDNLPHPANSRIALGSGSKTVIHAFGVDFEGDRDTNSVNSTFHWLEASPR